MPHFIFIQQISVLNISNMLYNLHFFSSKCHLFYNATLFGFCITHILNTGCAKIWKKKICRQKFKHICNTGPLPRHSPSWLSYVHSKLRHPVSSVSTALFCNFLNCCQHSSSLGLRREWPSFDDTVLGIVACIISRPLQDQHGDLSERISK